MAESMHTPGPWEYGGGQYVSAIVDGRSVPVAAVSISYRDSAERDANAKLIAVAPDMHAVCHALIHDTDIAQGFGGLYAHLEKLRHMARKVMDHL